MACVCRKYFLFGGVSAQLYPEDDVRGEAVYLLHFEIKDEGEGLRIGHDRIYPRSFCLAVVLAGGLVWLPSPPVCLAAYVGPVIVDYDFSDRWDSARFCI